MKLASFGNLVNSWWQSPHLSWPSYPVRTAFYWFISWNAFLGPLSTLKANIDAVKRRSGFDAIKENYNGELDKLSSETSDSRCSLSSGSQQDGSEPDEVISWIMNALEKEPTTKPLKRWKWSSFEGSVHDPCQLLGHCMAPSSTRNATSPRSVNASWRLAHASMATSASLHMAKTSCATCTSIQSTKRYHAKRSTSQVRPPLSLQSI